MYGRVDIIGKYGARMTTDCCLRSFVFFWNFELIHAHTQHRRRANDDGIASATHMPLRVSSIYPSRCEWNNRGTLLAAEERIRERNKAAVLNEQKLRPNITTICIHRARMHINRNTTCLHPSVMCSHTVQRQRTTTMTIGISPPQPYSADIE